MLVWAQVYATTSATDRQIARYVDVSVKLAARCVATIKTLRGFWSAKLSNTSAVLAGSEMCGTIRRPCTTTRRLWCTRTATSCTRPTPSSSSINLSSYLVKYGSQAIARSLFSFPCWRTTSTSEQQASSICPKDQRLWIFVLPPLVQLVGMT